MLQILQLHHFGKFGLLGGGSDGGYGGGGAHKKLALLDLMISIHPMRNMYGDPGSMSFFHQLLLVHRQIMQQQLSKLFS